MVDAIDNEGMEYGSVKIANEVVAIIAGLAATEVDGVAGMSGGVTSGITEALGMKSLSKGVKVEVGEKECAIDLFVVINYGSRISEVAQSIQENVKNAVETMTGLDVVEVNVNVQGVNIPKEEKVEEESRVK
ncbi:MULTISPECIES: Asp23/Gls24 family envelope stress response protein [Sporanaerobacter]|jgi:uncharacterized alkaline shock family protein YloU|uniref:Asp23/Gls24 family envelope stress response protein n=1 Tax=Sporanaerobacter TaxID=165812 RepID=UPI0033205FA5